MNPRRILAANIMANIAWTRSQLTRLGFFLHYCDGCCQPPIATPTPKAIEGGSNGGD